MVECLLFMFVWMIFEMGKQLVNKDQNKYKYSVAAYVLAVMIEAIVSESAINFVGSGCAFIILGFFTVNKKISK